MIEARSHQLYGPLTARRLMLTVLGGFEKDLIRARTAEGRERAKVGRRGEPHPTKVMAPEGRLNPRVHNSTKTNHPNRLRKRVVFEKGR